MQAVDSQYRLSKTTDLPFADAVERVRAELKAQGFGILCEIDVQQTLREKLGIEREPYLILGACNPPLAHRALEAEPDIGVLLPCNVVVYEQEGETRVAAVDPERMLSIVGTTSSRRPRPKCATASRRSSRPCNGRSANAPLAPSPRPALGRRGIAHFQRSLTPLPPVV